MCCVAVEGRAQGGGLGGEGIDGAGRLDKKGTCETNGPPSPTHTDKSHTCERSRNAYGSLSGADRSTARDAALWSPEDVARRMEFSVACAYAHGTAALRTHLINMDPKQVELTWPAFAAVRAKWAGKVSGREGGVGWGGGVFRGGACFLFSQLSPPPTLHRSNSKAWPWSSSPTSGMKPPRPRWRTRWLHMAAS